MKKINFTLTIAAVLVLLACSTGLEDQDKLSTGEHSFYITGINQSLTYTFSPANGRQANSTPEDVKNLTIMILDEHGNLAYEQHYYNYTDYYYMEDSLLDMAMDFYYFERAIPDTIFIPKLGAGEYTILAATADFYYQYYYYRNGSDGQTDGNNGDGKHNDGDHPDSTFISKSPRLQSSIVSEGPIYVGKEVIYLNEDEQEVVMGMENISARITVKKPGTSAANQGWLELQMETKNGMDYSFSDDDFVNPQYENNHLYTYIDWQQEKNFYVLPKTITNLRLNYYDYYTRAQINQTVDIDPDVELGVGDAITFSVDLDALLKGSGSGVFDWEEINWNDLGEISVP